MSRSLMNVLKLAKELGKRGTGKMGNTFRKVGERIVNNTGPWTKEGLIAQFGPDVFFGTVGGLATQGDAGDKWIAGITQGVGGGLGGVALRGLVGPRARSGAGLWMSEIAGGYGGDMAGMAVGDQILRWKGGGTTPWEKLQAEDYERLRAELYQQLMREQGLVA